MNTVDRYIFRRVAFASLGAFAAIISVVWITQALTRLDLATGSGSAIVSFLTIMALLVPEFAALTLPFGILIGTVNVLNAMNTDSEMPVLSGSGLSRVQLARPIILFSLMCATAVFLINHFVEPRSGRLARDIIIEVRTDLLATLIQEGRFVEIENGLTIYVDRKQAADRLEGVMIADRRNQDVHLIQHAREAHVDESTGEALLVLRDGQIHREDVETGSVSVIKFDAYAVSLAQFSRGSSTTVYFIDERETSYLLDPDPNDPTVKTWPGQVTGELHRRMSDWLYAPLFALVALVLAGQPQTHRTASMIAVVLAFGAGLGYRWGSFMAYHEVKANANLFWLLYAIPLAGIVASIAMFLTGRTVTIPDWLPDRLGRLANALPRLPHRAVRRTAG